MKVDRTVGVDIYAESKEEFEYLRRANPRVMKDPVWVLYTKYTNNSEGLIGDACFFCENNCYGCKIQYFVEKHGAFSNPEAAWQFNDVVYGSIFDNAEEALAFYNERSGEQLTLEQAVLNAQINKHIVEGGYYDGR